MKKGLLLGILLSFGCPDETYYGMRHPRAVLAPGVTHADNLRFATTCEVIGIYEPLPCNGIKAYSHDEDGTLREEWEVQTTNKPLPCPDVFTWGQDFGAAWEVLRTPLPLERNRLYTLSTLSSYDLRERGLHFYIFDDGSIEASYFDG